MPSKKRPARKTRRPRGEGMVTFSESKGTWRARAIVGVRPDGRPLYKEVTGRTQAEALTKKRQAEEDAKAGRLVPGQREQTVGEFVQHWLDNVSKPSVRETTWESYERCVRLHIKPRLGGHKLGQLRPQHVERFFAEMVKDGMSQGNAKKVAQVLGTALAHAQATGLIVTSPVAVVAHPKPEVEEIVPFTPEEVRAILQAAEEHRLFAMLALAVATGCRLGELLGLSWEHVDLKAGTIRIERSLAVVKGGFKLKEPKSRRGRRVIDIPRFAVDALTARRAGQMKEGTLDAPVIFCTRTGQFTSKSSFLRQTYAGLLVKANVPYRKFHTFRHTHASELLSRGVPVVDVARRIGDRPEVVLAVYAHYLPGNAGGIAGKLDDLYGRPGAVSGR